jgi:AbrB family looped-hinge helix DNA binding protein
MIETAKISSKGQVTLPKKVRRYLEVDQGDTVIFELKDNVLVVRKSRSIEHYFNTLKPLEGDFKEKVAREIARETKKSN